MNNVMDDRFLRFSLALETIGKNIQRFKNEQLSSFGLRGMHLMFMYSLFKADHGLTAGELAKCCGVDKAFISRTTKELMDIGYVEYPPRAPEEYLCLRYKKRLSLTEEGRAVMGKIESMINDTVLHMTDGVSPEQIETFYTVIAKLDSNLNGLLEPEEIAAIPESK